MLKETITESVRIGKEKNTTIPGIKILLGWSSLSVTNFEIDEDHNM